MELKVLEKKKDKLKVEVRGESHTLLNLVTEYAWLAKASQSFYIIKHPYLSEPKLVIGSSNPKKTLTDSAQMIIDRAKDFKHGFDRVTRK